MAKTSSKKTDAKTAQKKLNLKMRGIINDAYAFVRGREFTKKLANTTYEQLVDEAIEHIEGTSGKVPLRPTLLTRIETIKTEIKTAVETVSKKGTSYWSLDNQEDPKDSVNTPVTETESTTGSTTTETV